jgi:hypothetical protein
MIVVHHSYNKCTTLLHMGWAPHTVEPTPCEGVLYICCTLGVHESLPFKNLQCHHSHKIFYYILTEDVKSPKYLFLIFNFFFKKIEHKRWMVTHDKGWSWVSRPIAKARPWVIDLFSFLFFLFFKKK